MFYFVVFRNQMNSVDRSSSHVCPISTCWKTPFISHNFLWWYQPFSLFFCSFYKLLDQILVSKPIQFYFKMYNYDDLIGYVGISSYQIIIMICSSLMIWPSGLNNVAPMFLMETPPFHAKQAWLDQRIEFKIVINHCSLDGKFSRFWPRRRIWPA